MVIQIGEVIIGGTAGRILFEGAGPVLADSANLTWNGSTILVQGGSSTDIAQLYNSSGVLVLSFDQHGNYVTKNRSSNLFLGSNAGGSAGPTTGDRNVGIGLNSLAAITTGADNMAIGSNALPVATSAYGNVAIGSNALLADTDGQANMAIGYYSLYQCTHGYQNTAIGSISGSGVTTGTDNICIGTYTGGLLGAAQRNVCVGTGAGYQATGSNNILIGYYAAYDPSSGHDNILIGYNAEIASTQNNCIFIGGGSQSTTADYQMILGTVSHTAIMPGGLRNHRTPVSNSYSILPTDCILGVTSTAGAYTLTLPTAVGVAGQIYVVKDESGGAATHNVTLATTSAQTVDGASTKTIATNYGTLRVYSDGTNWFTF